MNEQLVVKNFGPIQDATVDFKRVTVFIGPTGGGKSTLAKLAAVFRDGELYKEDSQELATKSVYADLSIDKYFSKNTEIICECVSPEFRFVYQNGKHELKNRGFGISFQFDKGNTKLINTLIATLKKGESELSIPISSDVYDQLHALLKEAEANPTQAGNSQSIITKAVNPPVPNYLPAERTFVPALEYSWAGLMRDDIGLPKLLLNFANSFSLSRKEVPELDIPFLYVKYLHRNGQDFIEVPGVERLLRLFETASGIQSVTPLLVLLEHLSRNTEQAQSFIIEEPELNLYPTAQQGLLNWLVEKCTKGENDLTITTHSPYILSHLNLLLYAYQVAEQHPERREEVAALVPEASWINPKEFACYQVENGGVQSLVNEALGMIDNNELDALSGDAADAFDNLIRLSKGIAVK